MGELRRTDRGVIKEDRTGQKMEDAQLMEMKKEEEEQNKQNPNKPIQLNLHLFIQLIQLSHSTQLNSLSNPYPTLPYPILSYFIPIQFYSTLFIID